MEKKHIKVKILGTYYQGELVKYHTLYPILMKYFDVEFSETPDFIIATPLDKPFEYCNYDCVRILFTGENFSPDFNVFDYAITCDDILFRDRFYRFQQFNSQGWGLEASKKHIGVPEDLLRHKKYFCDFIYKNSNGQKGREALFRALSKYKRVESGGTWLNNMPDGKVIGWPEEKQEFQKKCKFTIAVDSMQYPGFITEKITNAFMNRSIPIYLGAPDVESIFNPNAFINCANYSTLDEVVKHVEYIDQNDDVYMEMIKQPAFLDLDFAERTYQGLVDFVIHIFSQSPSNAKRCYPDKFSQHTHLNNLRMISAAYERENQRLKYKLRRGAKRILGDSTYESLKEKLK